MRILWDLNLCLQALHIVLETFLGVFKAHNFKKKKKKKVKRHPINDPKIVNLTFFILFFLNNLLEIKIHFIILDIYLCLIKKWLFLQEKTREFLLKYSKKLIKD